MSIQSMLLVSIGSKQFPGSFLRIDGTGVTSPLNDGGGVANCQNYVGPYETLMIENHPDTNTFSILSSAFPKVYLRMDGSSAQVGGSYPSGAGIVNCQ